MNKLHGASFPSRGANDRRQRSREVLDEISPTDVGRNELVLHAPSGVHGAHQTLDSADRTTRSSFAASWYLTAFSSALSHPLTWHSDDARVGP